MKVLCRWSGGVFGDREQVVPLSFPEWLDEIVAADDYPASEEREHFLGVPLAMPDGRVSFPISGWLTKNLGVW